MSSQKNQRGNLIPHGACNEDSSDDDLSNLIANSNFNAMGGIKSQTLQFQTQLGNDFLQLFAKEGSDDGDDEREMPQNRIDNDHQDGYADFEDD